MHRLRCRHCRKRATCFRPANPARSDWRPGLIASRGREAIGASLSPPRLRSLKSQLIRSSVSIPRFHFFCERNWLARLNRNRNKRVKTRPFSFFDAHFGELCSLVPVEVLVHGVMLYLTPNLLGHQARARLRIPLWSPFGHHRGDRFLANESPSVNEQRSALSDQQPAGTMKNGFYRL